jgi:hypothetical protein
VADAYLMDIWCIRCASDKNKTARDSCSAGITGGLPSFRNPSERDVAQASAAAPDTISVSSVVMRACRARL